MSSAQINKIDVSSTYPCPCRRHGHLSPILLTDALGCEQCHHVFVVKPDGYTIEQCSAHSPPKTWYWTGRRWHLSRHRRHLFYLRLLFCCLLMGIIVLLVPAFFPRVLPSSVGGEWRMILIVLAVFIAFPTIRLGSYLYRYYRY